MNIRERTEQREYELLQPWAAKSREAMRLAPEEDDDLRTRFQRDRDRVIHSSAFRKLKHKTQVYLQPGDHYRTRLTHSMEVSQIARTIGRALGLNEDMIEAAALGHDLGHTPFGHAGEKAIRKYMGHFKHNEQSLRVVRFYGRQGRGLNLTTVVQDAIVCHTGETLPRTPEGAVVRRCDRLAYLCHDFDDAVKAGIIGKETLPGLVAMRLGTEPSQILDILVHNIVECSQGGQDIVWDSYYDEAVEEFRNFMFAYVYEGPVLEKEHRKAEHVVLSILDLYMKTPSLLPDKVQLSFERFGKEQAIIDYVSGLTDLSALATFQEYFIPKVN